MYHRKTVNTKFRLPAGRAAYRYLFLSLISFDVISRLPALRQVVRFVPPLVATAADVSAALSIIDQALAKVTGA